MSATMSARRFLDGLGLTPEQEANLRKRMVAMCYRQVRIGRLTIMWRKRRMTRGQA